MKLSYTVDQFDKMTGREAEMSPRRAGVEIFKRRTRASRVRSGEPIKVSADPVIIEVVRIVVCAA